MPIVRNSHKSTQTTILTIGSFLAHDSFVPMVNVYVTSDTLASVQPFVIIYVTCHVNHSY